jgi:PAS domain S-box-containing protein
VDSGRLEILATAIDHMDQGVSIVGADLRLVGVNRRFREILEFPESMCRPGTPMDVFFRYNAQRGDYGPGEVEEQVRTRMERARRFEAHHFERERPDGTVLEVRGTPVPGGGLVTQYTDVTRRVRYERALRASEARKSAILDSSIDAILTIDHRGRIVEFNPAAERCFGRTREQAVGSDMAELIVPPELRERHREGLRRYLATGESNVLGRRLELPALRADGTRFDAELTINLIPGSEPAAFTGTLRDIGERVAAAKALRDALSRLDLALEAGGVCTWDYDLRSGGVVLSEFWAEMTGAPPGVTQTTFESLAALVHPEDTAPLRALLTDTVKGKRDDYVAEHRVRHRRGQWRWMLSRGRVSERDAAGRALRMIGTNIDITARVRGRQLNELELAVAQIFAAKRETIDAVEAAMRAICEAENWDCARYLVVDESAGLARFGHAWSVTDAGVERYIEESRGMTYTPGAGLVGMAWQARESLWSSDIVSDARSARPQLARETGLRSCLAAPIVVEGTVFGILIFHSRLVREPDEQLLQGLRVIGGQIGLYLKRSQAEAETRRHERELRLVMDGVPSPVTRLDREERFVFVNRAYAELMERPAEAIVGRSLREIVSAGTYAIAKPYVERVLAGESVQFPRPQQRSDGGIRMLEMNYIPDVDERGATAGWFGILLDVTEAFAARQRLESMNVELEQRVADRTEELRTAVKDLEAYSYSVSHDLRAPIGAINGFANLLRMKEAGRLTDDGRKLLGFVESNAVRMTELVEGLLMLSRIGRQAMARRPVAMRDLVREVLAESSAAVGAGIEIAALPDCTGDVPLLRQVWVNLIGNALKFSRGRTPARIEIGFEAGAKAYFVRDSGAGFDMKYAGKLFGVFERLHSDEEFEGTGIGLATVQRIVARHGGRVWARAAPGEGATFWFTVPE